MFRGKPRDMLGPDIVVYVKADWSLTERLKDILLLEV